MPGNEPIWKIFRSGTSTLVTWKAHAPNPRFAIYDPIGNSNPAIPATLSDDLVLDRETGLVWARDAKLIGAHNWLDSNTLCREFQLGSRFGWRLPAIEELASLVVPTQSPNSPTLPSAHPFVNVQHGPHNPTYWSSTNYENPTGAAWFVNFSGGTGLGNKSISGYAWPVRGGRGGNNWNW